MTIWHKICIGLGALLLLAVFAWAWDLWSWKRSAQRTLAVNHREWEAAQAQVEAVRTELNQATTTITELKARKPGDRVVLREVPADCVQCFKKHKISVSTHSPKGWWSFEDPDVLDGEPGTLALHNAFWDATVGPYKKATEDCQKRLDEALGKPPGLFRHGSWLEARAAYGISGMEAEVGTWPLEVGGRRFSFQVGAFTRATLAPDGLLTGQVAAGIKVLIR
jgi:hypothetical protein